MTDYNDYVDRLEQIRRLSTPSMQGIPNEVGYSERLKENFLQIGRLAAENRAFLRGTFFPTIAPEHALTEEDVDSLAALGDALLSASDAENLDLPIMELISGRLLKNAEAKGDAAATIRSLDARMDTCYALMMVLGRANADARVADLFRQEGLEIGRRLFALLDHDAFAALDAQCREIVLTDVRYMAVLYEGLPPENAEQHREIDHLDKVLALSSDPYYRELTPGFDWRFFTYRVLDYYAKVTDMCNLRRFDAPALERILERTEQFAALWNSDPDFFSRFDTENQVNMLLYRNRWLAGRISRGAYLRELIGLYARRDRDRYDLNGIYDNLQLPLEAICMLDPDALTGEAKARLTAFYRDMIRYAFRMPNSGGLSTLLEYYANIVDRFIEVPGGLSFEEMGLQCLAALHPPTYIHSVMVGKLARCLCDHLIDLHPRLLSGVLGCDTAEAVRDHRERIADFAYHAGLCHDFGKLTIIDTIFVYGRDLLDMEFGLIRSHPRVGHEMLMKHASTRAYADVALGHHRWYDNSRGYPEDFDTESSPLKPIIDLVLCADCMDAATDSVGRSYRPAKTFEAFEAEVISALGTHYAPWLPEIIAQPDVRQLLDEGRRETYESAYHLLKAMDRNAEGSV